MNYNNYYNSYGGTPMTNSTSQSSSSGSSGREYDHSFDPYNDTQYSNAHGTQYAEYNYSNPVYRHHGSVGFYDNSQSASYRGSYVAPSETYNEADMNMSYDIFPGYEQNEVAGAYEASPPRSGDSRSHACTVDGCDKTFKRSTDMKRHLKSVHYPEYFDCKYAKHGKCNRKGKDGFVESRHDHYNDHLREVHQQNIPKSSKAGTGGSPTAEGRRR